MQISPRKIQKSFSYDESIDVLWWRWTSHEGLKTFFGKDNHIELKEGGAFEIYFLLDNPIGLRGSESCSIIQFKEFEQLSFTWNAPPHLEMARNSSHKTIVNISFNKELNHKTLLTITHSNWPQDENWNEVFNYFQNAWDLVLESLKQAIKQK